MAMRVGDVDPLIFKVAILSVSIQFSRGEV